MSAGIESVRPLADRSRLVTHPSGSAVTPGHVLKGWVKSGGVLLLSKIATNDSESDGQGIKSI